jgi:hypothetical protein
MYYYSTFVSRVVRCWFATKLVPRKFHALFYRRKIAFVCFFFKEMGARGCSGPQGLTNRMIIGYRVGIRKKKEWRLFEKYMGCEYAVCITALLRLLQNDPDLPSISKYHVATFKINMNQFYYEEISTTPSTFGLNWLIFESLEMS